MLVLSRKHGEKEMVGNAITLTVLDVAGNNVRVGIDAPRHVPLLRVELAGRQHGSVGSDDRLDSDLQATSGRSQGVAAVVGQEMHHRKAIPVPFHIP